MINSFTDRLKTKHVVLFTVIVFLGQQLEHTDLLFSMLTSAFIVISALSYNAAGGLSYPSGAFILFNALLTAIAGVCFKILLGEPGQSNLLDPNTTLAVYCATMAVMGFTVALSHRLRPKRALLPTLDRDTMRFAALGCIIAGGFVQVATASRIGSEGSFASALHQLNYLPRMALVLATIYEIDKSGGRRSTNWIVWLSGSLLFFYGIIEFSKEGLFVSPVTWFLTCVLYGFRFTWKQIATLVVFAAFAQIVLVPFSQYGRRSRTEVNQQGLALQSAIGYLTHPLETRAAYLDELSEAEGVGGPHLFTSQQPFMERLTMFAFDDAIINYTDKGNVFGLPPTYAYYINVVPRFLWKDKPPTGYGNTFAHELGVLGDDDFTTGISFSPAGDAYHEAKWFGVLVVWPIVIFLYFFITDSLTGSVRDTPYALLPIALASHVASEGLMGGAVYLQTYGAFLLILIAYLAKNVLARLTQLALGGDRVRVLRTRDFLPGYLVSPRRGGRTQEPDPAPPPVV